MPDTTLATTTPTRTIAEMALGLTVIIPAYNEEASVGETVRSVLTQTTPPGRVIVVDDGSTDRTGELAELAGAEVAAACGFVVPRHVGSLWERGRYVEYLMAFTLYKPIQDYYGKPMISSGCFSAYDTVKLKAAGGWSERTRAEDMDLTWTFHAQGHKVRFVPEAVCYPIEPHDFTFMGKQLKRWSHGFVQNVRLHWNDILPMPMLRNIVGVAMWDAVIASFVYLPVLPILAVVPRNPWLLLAYVFDLPALLVPILTKAWSRGEVWRALTSMPSLSCCAPSTRSTCWRLS